MVGDLLGVRSFDGDLIVVALLAGDYFLGDLELCLLAGDGLLGVLVLERRGLSGLTAALLLLVVIK